MEKMPHDDFYSSKVTDLVEELIYHDRHNDFSYERAKQRFLPTAKLGYVIKGVAEAPKWTYFLSGRRAVENKMPLSKEAPQRRLFRRPGKGASVQGAQNGIF